MKILPQRTHNNLETKRSTKKFSRIEIPSEYSFKFSQDMEDVTYSIAFVTCHGATSNNTGHYFCEILDFNTGIWWRCDDDTIT